MSSVCVRVFVIGNIQLLLACAVFAADVTITVKTTTWEWRISDRLVGLHQVYTSTPDSVYADGSIAAWAKRAGVATSRYPGGTIVKYWDWENPSGQRAIDNYDPNFDPADNRPESQWMSLDEYLDFVDASGIQPHFGVNTASASVNGGANYPLISESACIARAVRMVQYVKNKGHGGAWWYLGNEEAHWHGGTAAYAKVCARYAQAMKAVDPDIKLFWNQNGASMADVRTFLNNDGGWMDGLDPHTKWPYGGSADYGVKSFSDWQNDLPMQDYRFGVKWRYFANNQYRQAAADVGRSILVSNSEYGIGKDNHYTGFNRYTKGLMLTEFLMEMFIGNWDMSCFWDMNNGADDSQRGLLDELNGYRFNPFHFGMDMLADAQGGGFCDILPTWTQRQAEPTLHGFAARKGGDRLVYLLNKGNGSRSVQLKLSDASYPAAWARRMQNSADKYGEMVAVAVSGTGTTFTVDLPALSFTQIVFGSSPLPVVDNGSGADGVGSTTATLNGNLVDFGFSMPEVTVYWGDEDGGSDPGGWDHAVPLGFQDIGPLSTDLTGLLPATTYYYRFQGTNDFGEAWSGSSATFTTYSGDLPPVVDAGPDKTVLFPLRSVGLAATITYHGASPVTNTWSLVSGPGEVSFGERGRISTVAIFSEPGSYTLRMTADDGVHPPASDDVRVTVQAGSPAAGYLGECGTVEARVYNDDDWHALAFRQTYANPVVMMGPPSANGSEPAVMRVRNLGPTGFEFRIDEWDYLTSWHSTEAIGFLVVEAGDHLLTDGTRFVAGTTTIDDQFAPVSFPSAFGMTPTVLAQAAGFSGPAAVTERLQNAGPAGFEVRLQEEENADGNHALESLCWIAIEPAVGTTGGLKFESAVTPQDATEADKAITFSQGFAASPVFLASIQTYAGSDTCALRWRSLDSGGATVFLEEETSADTETTHGNAESIGWLAIEPGLVVDAADFAKWIARHPGVGPQTGFGDDPDGDGIPSGVEGVLGSDPSTPDECALTTTPTGGGSLTFSHSLSNAIPSDVEWRYEWSVGMEEWNTSGQTDSAGVRVTVAEDSRVDNEAPDNDLVTVTATVDPAGTPTAMLFLRLIAWKLPTP